MLGGCHGTSINVHVRVNLDGRHFETGSLQQQAGTRGYPVSTACSLALYNCIVIILTDDTLADTRDDTTSNDNILLGHLVALPSGLEVDDVRSEGSRGLQVSSQADLS